VSTVKLKKKPRKGGAGVYALVTEFEGGRVYIGESIDLYRRFKEHRSTLDLGTHANKELQALYDLGADFTFTVLREQWYDFNKPKTHIKPQLEFWESFYIIKFQKVCINRDSPYARAQKMSSIASEQLQYHLNPSKRSLVEKYLVKHAPTTHL